MNRIFVFFFIVFLLFSTAYCNDAEYNQYRLTLESIPEDSDLVEVPFRSIRLSLLYQTAYFEKAKQYDEVVEDFLDLGKRFQAAVEYVVKIERRILFEKYLYPAVFVAGLFCGGYVVAQIQ